MYSEKYIPTFTRAVVALSGLVSALIEELDEGSRRVLGFGRARFMRSYTQPLAPQHVSLVLGVQVPVNQEPMAPAKHVQSHSRRARAVLELCHGLSAPLRRRGAHVALSRDLDNYSLGATGARCSVESHLLRSHLVPSCRIGRLQLEF